MKRKRLILLPQTVPSIWWQSNVLQKKVNEIESPGGVLSPLKRDACLVWDLKVASLTKSFVSKVDYLCLICLCVQYMAIG